MKTLGICFGAASMQYVILQSDPELSTVIDAGRIVHEGNPEKTYLEYIDSIDHYEIDRIAVTGRNFRNALQLSSISEPEAIEKALKYDFKGEGYPELVISNGGETLLAYRINGEGGIQSVHSGNKCASGTGEFFLQQVRRMGLTPSEAVSAARGSEPYPVAGRCSVFCKSDCTHALNKGIPVANVSAGLCSMMADKVDELVKDMPSDHITMVGGGVLNTAMMEIFRKRHNRVTIPDCAQYYEAFGAALWAKDNICIELAEDAASQIIHKDDVESAHSPLHKNESLVEFKNSETGVLSDGDECIIGLDVGSTTTKAVLLKVNDKKIAAKIYLRTNGDPVGASKNCYRELNRQIQGKNVNVIGLGVTGSGRQVAGLHSLTENIINEIIAHATAAAFYDKDVDTIYEIGGQDAKYTFLTEGVPSDYAMNEACSAGTGSFLEESAKEMLGVEMEEIAEHAMRGDCPPDFTDQCAAFISSDVKRASQKGVSRDNIIAGLVYSICLNYLNRVKGNRPTGKKVFMQGGVCYNKAVPVAMASLMKSKVVVPPDPGLMGAFGVALETLNRIDLNLAEKSEFDLLELSERVAEDTGSFICAGGTEKCDRKCEINRIKINEKIYAFGGMCDKYYNMRISKEIENIESLDLVDLRSKLMFEKYGAENIPLVNDKDHYPKVVGLSRSLLTHSLYPLFANFFSRLGFTVKLSDHVDPEGLSRVEAAFCQPVELAHGNFLNLLKKQVDYIFMPQVMQIPVKNVPTYSRLCPFIQGEPYYMKTTFRNEIEEKAAIVLDPVLKMGEHYISAIDVMVDLVTKLGVNEKNARQAWSFACDKQIAFENELRRIGREVLYQLEKNPSETAIVLFGRPYNAFASNGNMGIPHKVASRGYRIIPLDMLPYDDYEIDKKMFWAMGQKIMKAAQFVKEHSSLFGFYITNFSCGPDSFLLGYFRKEMGEKPSLTLELDKHTADAGVDTRIEAALDIIKRYRNLEKLKDSDSGTYKEAYIDWPFVYSSSGKKYHIKDKNVEILIPSFGKKSSEAVAAILRSQKFNAKALPVLDKEGLHTGRKNTTGKECLPYIINTGAFLEYLNKKDNSEKISLFMMATGGGPCRLGQYFKAFENVIAQKKIPNAAMLTITDENGYGGMGVKVLLKGWQAVLLTDVLSDVKSMLAVSAVDKEQALMLFDEMWKKCMAYFEGKVSIRFTTLVKFVADKLKTIPLKIQPEDIPVISLVGEIFVRRDEFSRKDLVTYLEENGFMVRVAPLSEYVAYGNYVVNTGLGERKFTFMEHLKMKLSSKVQLWWERKIKTLLSESGLYHFEMIEVDKTIHGVNHLLNENFRGECILTVGLGMREILEDSCGIISIGPFGCMYSRMAESILKKEMNSDGKARMPGWEKKAREFDDVSSFPFLSLETDGKPFPQLVEANLESFVLQAKKLHQKMMKMENREIPDNTTDVLSLSESK